MAARRKLKKRDSIASLATALARILIQGEPTRFRYEGACRHGLRSALCLQGLTWARADDLAAKVLSEALRSIGAHRPLWHEGQPEFTRIGGRMFCANEACQKPIERESFQVLAYCSEQCRIRAKAKRAYGENAEERVAYAAAWRTAAREKAPVRSCDWCAREFAPLDYTGKKPQRFCSKTCRSRYASSCTAGWRPARLRTWHAEACG